MPIEEVRPGQRGVARTVFAGTEPEEFAIEVLGVARNGLGPGRDLIVVKLIGDRVERSGVVAGMSGSPVTIDGRLVGALSYRLGVFTKEPIAGVTPFAYMAEIPASAEGMEPAGAAVPSRALQRPSDRAAAQPDEMISPPAPGAGGDARPIAVPLVLAGAEPGLLDQIGDPLQRAGWLPLAGGTTAGPAAAESRPLAAGDAVGAQLMGGDLSVAATGTVTEVDGNRVWAFGHPFLRTGPTSLPMTRVEVVATVSSDFNSYKISNVGDPIGTFDQDQASGIAGKLGAVPPLVPLRVSLRGAGGGVRERRFTLIDHPAWSPYLVQLAVLNSLLPEIAYGEEVTVRLDAAVELAGQAGARFHEAYSSGGPAGTPALAAATEAGLLVASLASNRFERANITGITVSLSITPGRGLLTLERAEPLRRQVRPGETIEVRVGLAPYRGEPLERRLSLALPAQAPPGRLQIVVGSAGAIDQTEGQALAQQIRQLESVGAIIHWINGLRSSDRLYVKAYRQAAGAVVDGNILPGLPPSILGILAGDRSGGGFAYSDQSPVAEVIEAFPEVIVGSRTFTVDVLPPTGGEPRGEGR